MRHYITKKAYLGISEFDITVCGEPVEHTGFVVDIAVLSEMFGAADLCVVDNFETTAYKFKLFWDELEHCHPDVELFSLRRYNPRGQMNYHDTYYYKERVMKHTCIYDFCAAHRLHNEDLSDETNEKMFGKCNEVHGHNFQLEITRGEPITTEFDAYVKDCIIDRFDHKMLNDCEEFDGRLPTTETFCEVVWELLKQDKDEPLYRIAIRETPKNYFEYYGVKGKDDDDVY